MSLLYSHESKIYFLDDGDVISAVDTFRNGQTSETYRQLLTIIMGKRKAKIELFTYMGATQDVLWSNSMVSTYGHIKKNHSMSNLMKILPFTNKRF